MKVSDYIVRTLAAHAVRNVFVVAGGMIAHLLDSLFKNDDVKTVVTRHEQAAAFAAGAVGRTTGLPGIACATSGPGATNLLTGIADCYYDSAPALFITGQVNRYEQKGTRGVRQFGFQECDIAALAEHVTKAAWRVQDPGELSSLLERALELSVSGRPGPVLLDVPMDVQRAEVSEPATWPGPLRRHPAGQAPPADVEAAMRALGEAKRPLILAGGGIRASASTEALRQFVAGAQIPVVYSLMGVDALPSNSPHRVGMVGTYGNRWANLAVAASDLVLVLGSRLDVRQTGGDIEAWKGDRTIIQVDCDPCEAACRMPVDMAIICDLGSFLESAIASDCGARGEKGPRQAWMRSIDALRRQWPDTAELANCEGINPNEFMRALARESAPAASYVVDVGQHQMWAAQSLTLTPQQRFLTSGGLGAMGFSLPAAMGACVCTGETSVVITGDGGMQMNIQELETIRRDSLPVKIVVVNNESLGMVRQFQQEYFGSYYAGTVLGYSAPQFSRVAEAYGLEAMSVRERGEVGQGLRWLWAHPKRPSLLEVMVASTANAYPKISFGAPMTQMDPLTSLGS